MTMSSAVVAECGDCGLVWDAGFHGPECPNCAEEAAKVVETPEPRLCQGCGAVLPRQRRGRPRKWCSDACRVAARAGSCVDCGAQVLPRSKRCHACHCRAVARRRKVLRVKERAMVVRMWDEGASIREIAEALGRPPGTVQSMISRMRRQGVYLAYRRQRRAEGVAA